MRTAKIRNICISVFTAVFIILFHYESTRFFYLNPLFGKNLPKVPFLFPPAGWIMFFNVGDRAGYAEVYGIKDGVAEKIDPHLIIRTRTIGYDNIHRNILSVALMNNERESFCRFLKRRFPVYDKFTVTQVFYPELAENPLKKVRKIVYECK